jgi:hypothetical protein
MRVGNSIVVDMLLIGSCKCAEISFHSNVPGEQKSMGGRVYATVFLVLNDNRLSYFKMKSGERHHET